MSNVFVYGSLMHPQVLGSVLAPANEPVPPILPAVLCGYKRYPLKDEVYPACCRGDKDDVVKGCLIRGLSSQQMRLLDLFEGTEYERETVTVILGQDATDSHALSVQADIYVWRGSKERLVLDREWDFNQFQTEMLTHFMDDYAGYQWIATVD